MNWSKLHYSQTSCPCVSILQSLLIACSELSFNYSDRILAIVETVLNVVDVAPGDPFQFAAPEFGVHVESPPEDLRKEDAFTPNIAGLLSQIMNITLANMPMGELPELPGATVNLSSTLLSRNTTGSRPLVSAAIYGRDSLFQERPRNNREIERVGSIIVDISLRSNGSVISISRAPNSNVVRPSFTKSMVSHAWMWCENQSGYGNIT